LKKEYHLKRASKEFHVREQTLQEKHLAKLERDLCEAFEADKKFKNLECFGFTELLNQSNVIDEKKIIEEKFKGNFKVKIRKDLPEPMRIAQLASEPVAFHLHKRRDFLPRLEGKLPKDIKEGEKMRMSMRKVLKVIEERDKKKNPYFEMFI
jgi:hypothetical protein